ncbi:MAG: NFYB/HAP3 family transcription factor subunit [Candidatus Pacearchaeota archaeon]
MKHTKGTEFYLQQLRRIAKKEKKEIKISKKALIALANYLEKHCLLIFKKALTLTHKEKRKIIKARDIESAIKERSLLEYY